MDTTIPLFSKAWWPPVGERVARSAAQGALLTFGGAATDVFTLDWQNSLGLTIGYGVFSFLSAIAFPPKTEVPVKAVDSIVESALVEENARQGRLNKEQG